LPQKKSDSLYKNGRLSETIVCGHLPESLRTAALLARKSRSRHEARRARSKSTAAKPVETGGGFFIL
jgi:hypothetical protein